MEEPRNSKTAGDKEKKKLVITVGSGGGIGVGIVLLGGVIATAAFTFLFGTRRRKPTHGKNYRGHDHSTAAAEVPCNFMAEKTSKEEEDSEATHKDMDPNLRNGSLSHAQVHEKDGSAITRVSEESFRQDEKGRLEVKCRKEDPLSNDEDGVHRSSPKVLVRNLEFDGCVVKEDEFPFPMVGKEMLLLPNINVQSNTLSMQDDEKISKDVENGTVIFDPDKQNKGNRDRMVDDEGEQTDVRRWEVEDEEELHCKEALESNDTRSSLPRFRNFDQSFFQPELAAGNQSLCNHGKLDNYCDECAVSNKIGVMGKVEELEAYHEGQGKDITMSHIVQIDGSQSPEELKKNERPERTSEEQDTGGGANLIMEELEEKCKRRDSSLAIRDEANLMSKEADEFNAVMLSSAQSQANREEAELADDHAANPMLQQRDESGTSLGQSRTAQKCAENRNEKRLEGVQQPADFIRHLKEKLQLPKEEQLLKKHAFQYLNKAEDGGIPEKRLQKGFVDKSSLKSSLVRTYVEQLVELSQRTTNSHKRRILLFTGLVLSGWLRIWYFSRPFLKLILVHLRNYLMIKLHLIIKSYQRNHLRFMLVPKMLGI